MWNLLRCSTYRRYMQPSQFSSMPLGKDGRENELRRRARRRWRRDLPDDFTRDPVRHLIAYHRS
jgi:hypothetical protein